MQLAHVARVALFALLLAFSAAPAPAAASAAQLFGPTPYLSFADSPFSGAGLPQFYLEDFEDDLLNVPGVTASALPRTGVTGVVYGPADHDSVDADDGLIDGVGLAGESYFSDVAPTGITFTFDADALGGLPTHAGIVWTDGNNTVAFEAFDGDGGSLGLRTGDHADSTYNLGTTGDDRFYGVVSAGGVGSIRIFCQSCAGGVEVDHLQFGGQFDTTPPAITVNAPADGATYLLGESVFADYSCVDAESPVTACAGTVAADAPVNTGSVGTKLFTVEATSAGGSASETAHYSVAYGFSGFAQPIDGGSVVNTARAGQTVPVKWRLTDASGGPVTDLAGATIGIGASSACASGATDSIEEYASGTTGELANLGDGYYQINWKTSRDWSGSCLTMNLELGEAEPRVALFFFR